MLEEMIKKFGPVEAEAIAKAAVMRKGALAGHKAAATTRLSGLQGLREVHRKAFPTMEVIEFTDTRYIMRDYHCPVYEAWKQQGLTDERIAELADIYCIGDAAFAKAFDPRIELRFGARLMKGQPYCEWIYTIKDPKNLAS